MEYPQYLRLDPKEQDQYLLELYRMPQWSILRQRMLDKQELDTNRFRGDALRAECERYALTIEGIKSVFNEIDSIAATREFMNDDDTY